MMRQLRSYTVKATLQAGLFLGLFFAAVPGRSLVNEDGPFLRNLLTTAESLGYQYSSDPKDLSDQAWETSKVFIRSPSGELILTFDYQGEYFHASAYHREHILNLQGSQGQLIRQLLKGALPMSNPSPLRQIFLRSISSATMQRRILSLDLISYLDTPSEPHWTSRLYLMMDDPDPESRVQFLPAEITDRATASAGHLPLISLELNHWDNQSHLHYLRYLVPVHNTSPGQDRNSQVGIDMKTAYERLDRYRRFAVAIDVDNTGTTILPSIYDGREIISDVTLEIYALSNYIQGFLHWYTPVWWSEFPDGEHIRMKRNASDEKSLVLSLYRYRAHKCTQTVIKDLTSNSH